MKVSDMYKHRSLIFYAIGSAIIAVWTILRFITQRTFFDLVGQQVVAQQIIAGQGNGVSIGSTNYLLKTLFLYIPVDFLPGSPRFKLIILTILINITSYVLIGILLAKILQEFQIRISIAYYVALLWLAMVAGSVFWIEFTNSRNLEVAGGLLLVLLSLRYFRQSGIWRWTVLAAFGAVLFFADSLQLYMTAIPVLLFCAIIVVREGTRYRRVLLLGAAMLIAFIGSKLIFLFCEQVLDISFIHADTALQLSAGSIISGAVGTIRAYGHLLLGGADAGRAREVLDAVTLLVLLVLVVWNTIRRHLPLRLILLTGSILFVNSLIFATSNFPGQGEAERYLIMSVPALMLAFSAIRIPNAETARVLLAIFAVTLLVTIAALGQAVRHAWPTRFSSDAHTLSVVKFTEANAENSRVYASMDTSIPGAYLSGSYNKSPLPLACTNGKLVKTNLFYAKSAYSERESHAAQSVIIVLDGGAITNVPNVCNEQFIKGQLGDPSKTGMLADGSLYLVYPVSVAQKLTY